MISTRILRKFLKFDSLSNFQHFIPNFLSVKTWVGDFDPSHSGRQIQMNKSNELKKICYTFRG